MRQRGRKSSDNLQMISVQGRPSKLEPPAYLTAPERELFEELIAGSAPEHFRVTDLPVLVSLVQCTLLARSVGRDPDQIAGFEKVARLQAALATKLRLTPQSRYDPKTIGRQQLLPVGPVPWGEHKGTRRMVWPRLADSSAWWGGSTRSGVCWHRARKRRRRPVRTGRSPASLRSFLRRCARCEPR